MRARKAAPVAAEVVPAVVPAEALLQDAVALAVVAVDAVLLRAEASVAAVVLLAEAEPVVSVGAVERPVEAVLVDSAGEAEAGGDSKLVTLFLQQFVHIGKKVHKHIKFSMLANFISCL